MMSVCLCKDHETEARHKTCGSTGLRDIHVRFGHARLGQYHTSLPGIWYQQSQHETSSWPDLPGHLLEKSSLEFHCLLLSKQLSSSGDSYLLPSSPSSGYGVCNCHCPQGFVSPLLLAFKGAISPPLLSSLLTHTHSLLSIPEVLVL